MSESSLSFVVVSERARPVFSSSAVKLCEAPAAGLAADGDISNKHVSCSFSTAGQVRLLEA